MPIGKASIPLRINFSEVGKRVQKLFLLIIFFAFVKGYGQTAVQSVSYVDEPIRAESFERNTFGYKIFSSLALNNIKGLNRTIVYFKGRILIQTNQSDGHLFAYSKLIDYSLSGEDHFRGFAIDSLLVPSALSGVLRFTDDDLVSIEVPVELLLSGGVIDLSELNVSPDSLAKLKARIKVEKFVYTEEQWEAFQDKAQLINLYYAYNEILDRLIEKFQQEGIHRNQSGSKVFLAWHEISRINSYIKSHDFSANLNLRQNDPKNFLSNVAKSYRLEKRANTLFVQVLNLKSKSSLYGKKIYCRGLTDLSINYSKLAALYQPYIASGFDQVVRIFPNEVEFERIKKAAGFYDVFNKIDSVSTTQNIYNNYIQSAIETNKSEKFVLTLDLLYNAALISDNFQEVNKSVLQNQIYARTLDGLMSSYLHVAIMAYGAGSFDMADVYYRKAMDIYQLHQVNLGGEALSANSFLSFIEQQVDLAYGLMTDEKFRDGLRLVDQANSISNTHGLDYNGSYLDSAYTIGYLGIFKEKLDSVGNLIESTKIEQALSALEFAANFSEEKDNYIHGTGDDELKKHAQSLFDIYLNRGNRLMKSKQAEEALFAFLDAQSINELYLQEDYSQLDSLIYHATVPVILELLKKAEFEIWTNRMDNANLLLIKALALQEKYDQKDNPELITAFAALQFKIRNRACVNLGNKIFELQKKSENRTKSKKYAEADSFVKEAFALLHEKPECEIDSSRMSETKQKYRAVFIFSNLMSSIENEFQAGDFRKTVLDFTQAVDFYRANNIDKFGVDKPDLRKFVSQTNSKGLTAACVEFTIQQHNFDEAFFYLNSLKDAGVPSKETKELQKEIGTGLSKNGNTRDQLEKFTKGDKWFRYFRTTYLKN